MKFRIPLRVTEHLVKYLQNYKKKGTFDDYLKQVQIQLCKADCTSLSPIADCSSQHHRAPRRTSTGANTSNPTWNYSLALGQNFKSGMFRKSERDGYSNIEAMIKQISIY